jgi:hypothetical protein
MSARAQSATSETSGERPIRALAKRQLPIHEHDFGAPREQCECRASLVEENVAAVTAPPAGLLIGTRRGLDDPAALIPPVHHAECAGGLWRRSGRSSSRPTQTAPEYRPQPFHARTSMRVRLRVASGERRGMIFATSRPATATMATSRRNGIVTMGVLLSA